MSKKSKKNRLNDSAITTKDSYQGNDPNIGFGLFGNYGLSSAGVTVNQVTAVTSTAVFCAVRSVSEDLAKLPLLIKRRLPRGGSEVDLGHPLNAVLNRPNRWQNRFDLIAYVAMSLSLHGNAYVYVFRDERGAPARLYPIDPQRMSLFVAENGGLVYNISHPLLAENASFTCGSDDMIHVRGFSLNGYMGVSPLKAHANSVGLTIALDEYGGALFKNGAAMPGVLKLASTVSPEAITRIRESWRDRQSGTRNAGSIAVLEQGMDYSPIGMNNDEAQYLETRRFQIVEVARMFRVPPHKLFSLDNAHYNNLQAQNQSYADDTLLPIAVRFEEEAARVLLFDYERSAVKLTFDFSQLHRADLATRYTSYEKALNAGFMCVNEVRFSEGLGPVDGGDSYRSPLNMAPINAPRESGTASDDKSNVDDKESTD